MPCIRRKYHAAVVYLCPEIIDEKFPLCGQTVESLQDGEWHNVDFEGFGSIDDVADMGGVIIRGITGFTMGDRFFGPWFDIDPHAWLLGSKQRNGIALTVHRNDVIIISQSIPRNKKACKIDNVLPIRKV